MGEIDNTTRELLEQNEERRKIIYSALILIRKDMKDLFLKTMDFI